MTPEYAFARNNDNNILKWDRIEKGLETPYTQSKNGRGIDIQLNQPFFLAKCKFRVWDFGQINQEFQLQAWNIESPDYVEVLQMGKHKGWHTINLPQNVYFRFIFEPAKESVIKIVHFEASP